MENNVFFKIVCIDDNNVFEYRINEDTNRKTLDEIHEFVKQNINKYPNCKWLLLPCEITKQKNTYSRLMDIMKSSIILGFFLIGGKGK